MGTLLDIGANDGITFSNSRALLEKGWNGILFEPTKKAFEKLTNLYKDDPFVFCVQSAMGDKSGKMEIFENGEHINKGDSGLLSTLKESELKRWEGSKDVFVKTEVDVISWPHFLEISPYKFFDFITIDVEGMEIEILSQMDLKKIGCKMLCIEWNGNNYDKFCSIAEKANLGLMHKNPENLIFAL